MKRDIILFPCNGNSREALDALDESWNVLCFVDDNPILQGSQVSGIRVHDRSAFEKYHQAQVLAVPGAPNSYLKRSEIIEQLNIDESRWATVVHPSATLGKDVFLGRNVMISAGVVLTSNAKIHNHVVLLPNTVVHHDSEIGELTLVGSNVTVAGNTKVGKNCYIGSGSSLINGIELGDQVLVGMGAVVIRSVQEKTKIAGVPAKEL
jgi:sugar O-acyltransferase (sialic acid O-acetyltransferase NeuD family)